MVTHADWIAFREAVLAADFLNRTEFLRVVVHSQIRQPGNLLDAPPSKALLASQALRLVPGERHCPECFASFRLSFKYGVYRWCGPRYGDNRCHGEMLKNINILGLRKGDTFVSDGWKATAAVRIPHVRALTSDISWDATQAAKLNVAAAAPHLASGSTLVVSQEDARSLPNEAASIDFVVTDVPFGNRNRLVWVNGLLPAFLAEMGHARQVMQLLGTDETLASYEEVAEEDEEPCDASDTETTHSLKEAFRQLACHKVGVGGWPAAVLALERRQTEPKRKVAEAELRPGKGSGKAAKKAALGEPCECLLIERPISCPGRRLVDLLMQRWPSHFPTESVGRRVMGRGRVWVEDPTEVPGVLRPAWWSEPVTMKSVVFFPDYPRRSPYAGQLTVLYQDNCVGVVVKEPGLRIFGGIRTLANLLAAWPPPLIASTAKDALPAPVPVHFLEAELGGCFLVAKTAEAAFRLGRSPPRRQLRALLCGEEPLRQLQGHPSWRIRRVAPSVRFTKLTEASCPLQGPVAPFREECAQERLIILGDLQYGGEEAPKIRRSQVYLFVDTVAMGTNKSEWQRVPFKGDRDFFHADNLEPHATRRSEILKKHPAAQQRYCMVANLPIVFPYCITFKPYHMAHHRNQGVDGIDTDVPTALEGYLITQTSLNYVDHTLRKAVFMFLQIFAYALRPIFIKPDLVPIDGWVICNFAAARLREHGNVESGETYSYYGPLNRLAYNVGYHNEHHDFPNIAWSSLPKVRELAPEYYNSLPQCPSWPGAILRYIFDDSISPFSVSFLDVGGAEITVELPEGSIDRFEHLFAREAKVYKMECERLAREATDKKRCCLCAGSKS
eukprot:s54_g5.t3